MPLPSQEELKLKSDIEDSLLASKHFSCQNSFNPILSWCTSKSKPKSIEVKPEGVGEDRRVTIDAFSDKRRENKIASAKFPCPSSLCRLFYGDPWLVEEDEIAIFEAKKPHEITVWLGEAIRSEDETKRNVRIKLERKDEIIEKTKNEIQEQLSECWKKTKKDLANMCVRKFNSASYKREVKRDPEFYKKLKRKLRQGSANKLGMAELCCVDAYDPVIGDT